MPLPKHKRHYKSQSRECITQCTGKSTGKSRSGEFQTSLIDILINYRPAIYTHQDLTVNLQYNRSPSAMRDIEYKKYPPQQS